MALLLVVATALKLWLWWRAVGFEQGDPLEYVNIAYKIAFGIGIEWWDLRPLLLSLLFVPVLWVGQLWPDPSGEALVRMLRLVDMAFGLGAVALTYLLGKRTGGGLPGLVAGLAVALNPVFNQLSISTYAEVPSTFFVLLATALLLGAPSTTGWHAIAAGLSLGAACMIRFQAIIYLIPFGLWVWWISARSRAKGVVEGANGAAGWRFAPIAGVTHALSLRFALGLALAAGAQAVIDWIAYGRPFHSLIVSFDYNVTSGLAPVEFGAEPLFWYAANVAEWFGIVPMLLAIWGTVASWRGPGAAVAWLALLSAATMFAFLSALPHKELRFMAQVTPLLALLAGAGAAALVDLTFVLVKPSGRRVWVPVVSLSLIGLVAVPLLVASVRLDVRANVSYVDGPKRAAELRPGGTMGTIPWLIARPYAGARLTLERMDRRIWNDREHVRRVVEQSDFLLFPEYWLLEDEFVNSLVDRQYRTLEAYENGVVLLQNRRLDDPARRRGR